MPNELSVHAYADNSGGSGKKREPLVHLMGDKYGDVQSIAFHPDDAPGIAAAILAAGRAAKRGRNTKKILPLKLESSV